MKNRAKWMNKKIVSYGRVCFDFIEPVMGRPSIIFGVLIDLYPSLFIQHTFVIKRGPLPMQSPKMTYLY